MPEAQDPVPARLNALLLLAAVSADAGLLWTASHADGWAAPIAAAVAFSFVNNTVFSLLHESVHGILHPRPSINEWGGRVAAAFIPTGLGFQRIFHLGHHRRNRTAVEQFDYYRPGERRWLKAAQWYAILTGLYWAFLPLGAVVYLLWPGCFRRFPLRGDSALAGQTSADAMLGGFDEAPEAALRLEILFTGLLQAAVFAVLDLSPGGWLLCYAAFAVNWSSLQYADHAWSALDVTEGAWNLSVNPVVKALFLNYHDHLAHHQRPRTPWIHLPKYVDSSRPRPSFLSVYASMWRGPRPLGDAR
ncbi:MAG: fatty acid desaturase [Elusimicrobia bacterium]|nr:fatty acid desaturase [Elusimicrobiota bacterium]